MTSMASHSHVHARLHKLGVLGAVIVFAAALAIAIGTGIAGAAKVTVLGAAAPANPACPNDPCQVIARATGFQVSIGKAKGPFVVTERGKIVAWSIKLAAPNAEQVDFFNDTFGESMARISVLKPIQKQIKQGKPIYKLKAQSPPESLAPFFGQTTTFTLKTPLTVKPNQIVGLSVSSWAPTFSVNHGGQTVWQASRKSGQCAIKGSQGEILEQTLDGRAHEAAGSERSYGCSYKTARLLYSATVVKNPAAKAPAKPKPKN